MSDVITCEIIELVPEVPFCSSPRSTTFFMRKVQDYWSNPIDFKLFRELCGLRDEPVRGNVY